MNQSWTANRGRNREFENEPFHSKDESFHEFENEITERGKDSLSLQSDSSYNSSSPLEEDALANFLKNGKLSTRHKKKRRAAKFKRMCIACARTQCVLYTNRHTFFYLYP